MNRKSFGRRRVLLSILGFVAATFFTTLSGCLMYMADEFVPAQEAAQHAVAEQSSAPQITLAWDASAGPVQKYRVYFRIHGTTDWVQLAEIGAGPAPSYTVLHTTLGSGEFDFGVTAVYDSNLSSMHSSLDATASPTTGWYLKWQ